LFIQGFGLLTWHRERDIRDIVVLMVGTTKRLSVAIDHRLLAEARRLTRS